MTKRFIQIGCIMYNLPYSITQNICHSLEYVFHNLFSKLLYNFYIISVAYSLTFKHAKFFLNSSEFQLYAVKPLLYSHC